MKMSNQWRGLEEDEVAFLRDTADEKRQLERDLRKREGEELAAFRYDLTVMQYSGHRGYAEQHLGHL